MYDVFALRSPDKIHQQHNNQQQALARGVVEQKKTDLKR
jgi:hypothetical protein